jgi:hypothetical protein
VSNLLADFDPKVEPATRPKFGEWDTRIPAIIDGVQAEEFSFRCPTCGKHRISVMCARQPVVNREGWMGAMWLIAGDNPSNWSIHPSIWQHGHISNTGDAHFVECEWHRCIFKGRFIDELHAWPIDSPANAKFG